MKKAKAAEFRDRKRAAITAYGQILRGIPMSNKVADVVLRIISDTLDGQDARNHLGIKPLKAQTTGPLLPHMALHYWVLRHHRAYTGKAAGGAVAELWGTTDKYAHKISNLKKYRKFAETDLATMSRLLAWKLIHESAAKYRELNRKKQS